MTDPVTFGGAQSVSVEDASGVPVARALAAELAADAGLGASVVDRVALAATELAQNLHLHAVGGRLLVRVRTVEVAEAVSRTLSLMALDSGPGRPDFERCLEDGYSTAGTMGTGLGAVQRLAARFDAVSEPGFGTVVVAHFGAPATAAGDGLGPAVDIGTVGLPISSEVVSGDDWSARRHGSQLIVLVADGLGHGPDAADASGLARRVLAGWASASRDPIDITAVVGEVNELLHSTRGAAVTVAAVDVQDLVTGGLVISSGLGNVSVMVVGPDGESQRIATSHGTAGARRHTSLSQQQTGLPPGGLLLLHTDGLSSRWALQGRSALLRHSADVIAGALWRDFNRGSDDSLVVVVKAPM